MNKVPLGRLEKIDLRSYWVSESAEFTPWLAKDENVALLGDALGLELEVIGVEKDVGSFRADILCKVIGTDLKVLVENQLERTDHSHLGQVITYAAGLDVKTVVWIAKGFTEEHREALMWLNELSQDAFRFFGLEVELWRIGDSAPAPKFNIVVKPNDWTKAVREIVEGKDISPSGQVQFDFWSNFVSTAKARNSPLKVPQPQPKSWMNFRLGQSGVVLQAVASTYNSETHSYETGEIRAQLLIQNRNAQELYQSLLKDRVAIETEFGGPLIWSESEDVNRRRIYVRLTGDYTDRGAWPTQHEWLRTQLEGLQRVFVPRMRAQGQYEE